LVCFSLRPDVQGHPGRHGQEEVRDQVPQDVQRRERRVQHVQLHPGTKPIPVTVITHLILQICVA